MEEGAREDGREKRVAWVEAMLLFSGYNLSEER